MIMLATQVGAILVTALAAVLLFEVKRIREELEIRREIRRLHPK